MTRGATVHIDFPSNLDMLDLIQIVSDDMARRVRLGDDALHSVRVAVRESVINAIRHGNRNDASKRVHVEFVQLDGEEGPGDAICERDEGAGLDPATVAD